MDWCQSARWTGFPPIGSCPLQTLVILAGPVENNLEIQVRIPAVICAIHNFTRDHEPNIREPNNNDAHINSRNYGGGGGQFEAEGLGADSEEAVAMRDRIAELYTGSRGGGGGGGGIGVQI